MRPISDYITLDELGKDCAAAQFFDDVAEKLHDRPVYDYLKENVRDIHPTMITALLETLDEHDLELIDQCTDWFEVKVLKGRMLDGRKERAKPRNASHRLNYPIDEVLHDFIYRPKGKVVEAKRQLKKRFDGLDHEKQEEVMMALMGHGGLAERNFVYDKLYGDEFWTDDYIPLIQEWWKLFQDGKMAKVIVKYCPREYILEHLEELEGRCNYATLCLRTGITPNPDKLPGWTYLYVMKTSGGQLRFLEGEEVVFKWVRQYMYEEGSEKLIHSIYDVPYVRRMMAYLGEMGMVEDLVAIDEFEKKMHPIHRTQWGAAVIKAIEEKFNFPPFVYKNVE